MLQNQKYRRKNSSKSCSLKLLFTYLGFIAKFSVSAIYQNVKEIQIHIAIHFMEGNIF